MTKEISDKGVEFIKTFEKLRLNAYRDPIKGDHRLRTHGRREEGR